MQASEIRESMERKLDGNGKPVRHKKADIWEGLSAQLQKKPLSVLSRCSQLQRDTGVVRAEAKSRMVHTGTHASKDLRMKNVVVVVNEHRTLRKRAVSSRQEVLSNQTVPYRRVSRTLLSAQRSSGYQPNRTQRFDDARNAILIDEDPYGDRPQTSQPYRPTSALPPRNAPRSISASDLS